MLQMRALGALRDQLKGDGARGGLA